jgi:hypothetical protein
MSFLSGGHFLTGSHCKSRPNTEGKLVDGVSPDQRPSLVAGLLPVCFANVAGRGVAERKQGNSYCNPSEADFITWTCCWLIQKGVDPQSIGVICTYKAQSKMVAAMLAGSKADVAATSVEVNTVDAFQGGEKDVILLSCVRTSKQIGFMSSPGRANVSLTRAKHHLIIVGSVGALAGNVLWGGVQYSCCQN